MTRLLLVTIREAGTGHAYDAAWQRLCTAVAAAGGRAWRFHDPAAPDRRLEFIEWKQEPDTPPVTADVDVHAAIHALDGLAPALRRATWEETP